MNLAWYMFILVKGYKQMQNKMIQSKSLLRAVLCVFMLSVGSGAFADHPHDDVVPVPQTQPAPQTQVAPHTHSDGCNRKCQRRYHRSYGHSHHDHHYGYKHHGHYKSRRHGHKDEFWKVLGIVATISYFSGR